MKLKQTIKLFSLLGLLSFGFSGYAQTETELTHNAPTLQVGLDGLNFAKGTLDAELIMQIVAEKQKEVGLKLVQNMFLSKVNTAGGAFYSFTDNIIRGVVSERDINVITKKLLENTVNITFTYAFADYYIRTIQSEYLADFNSLAQCNSIKAISSNKNFTIKDLKLGLRSLKQEAPLATLTEDVSLNPNITKMIALMADMSSEAIRNNATLKELGIMQVSYAQSYEYLNEYKKLELESPSDFAIAKRIYMSMEATLAQYTNMIGLLYYGLRANSYRLNVNNVLKNIGKTSVITSVADMQTKIGNVNSDLQIITTNMQKLMQNSSDTTKFNRLYKAIAEIQQIKSYTSKAESYFNGISSIPVSTDSQALGINSDVVYTLYADIIPKLRSAGIWDSKADESVQRLEEICKFIYASYANDDTNMLKAHGSGANIEKFLSILSVAYQFDRANTFSNSVKLLSDLETIFPNERIKDALVFINAYIRDFVAVYKDANGKEYIGVNVESLISRLSAVKSDKLRRGSVLFNVGANTTYFPNELLLEDGSKITNFSFVSEKIGFKLKFFDKSFWRTRNPGETYTIGGTKYKKTATPSEPVISNMHAIVYGSGILYNIFNTGTTKNFNAPMIGTGLGISFFNSLDFNVTAGFPILRKGDSGKSGFIGFGFDFPLQNILRDCPKKS
ncbi:hypothetical protein [Pedobacter steynii]